MRGLYWYGWCFSVYLSLKDKRFIQGKYSPKSGWVQSPWIFPLTSWMIFRKKKCSFQLLNWRAFCYKFILSLTNPKTLDSEERREKPYDRGRALFLQSLIFVFGDICSLRVQVSKSSYPALVFILLTWTAPLMLWPKVSRWPHHTGKVHDPWPCQLSA